MAERQINTKKGNLNSEKYPTPNMTGVGNESAEHGHDKKDDKSSRDDEASQEKEENTMVKVAKPKAKGKSGNKSDSSEPVDDDSDKNVIDDDVPLSFPQRVSCWMSGRVRLTSGLL
jgi:hypothetical protein